MPNRAGKVSLITEPTVPSDARLRRAQALSHQSGTALEIIRELICAKLKGQQELVRCQLNDARTADFITELQERLRDAETLDRVAQLESHIRPLVHYGLIGGFLSVPGRVFAR